MGLGELIAEAGGAEAAEGPELGTPEKAEAPEKGQELGLEGGEDGAPKTVPWTAVAEQRARRREAEEKATRFEARVKELEEKHGSYSKEFEALYGKFEKPLEQLKEDAAFAEAWWALRDDPVVKQALAKIQQHHQGAVKVSNREAKPETAAPAESKTDPQVEVLLRERALEHADRILTDYKVRPELRDVIKEYVISNNPNPTKENVFKLMQEYVNSRGWTTKFLRGGDGKPKPQLIPNPGGLNAGAPKKDAPRAPEKPKSLSEVEARNRSKFKELLNQRLG